MFPYSWPFITRRDFSGTIFGESKPGQKYWIEWCTGLKCEQEEGHLFGDFFRRDPHQPYGYVVALDEKTEVFHLGQLRDFCPDHERTIVKPVNVANNGQQSTAK